MMNAIKKKIQATTGKSGMPTKVSFQDAIDGDRRWERNADE